MKRFLLLMVIGIVLFMPRGVEAKTINFFDVCTNSYIHLEEGDILYISKDELKEKQCPFPVVTGFSVFDSLKDVMVYNNSNEIYKDDTFTYQFLPYKEISDVKVPKGKKVTIELLIQDECSFAFWLVANYKLVDYVQKEVVYHNTYNSENNNPTTYYEGETDILLNDISRDGYKFLGWYTSPTFEEDTRVTMITKDVPEVLDLYARWEKIDVGSNEDNIFKNPETNSTSYILIGILSIAILGTILIIVYRIKIVCE